MHVCVNKCTDNRCMDETVFKKNVLSEVFPSLAPNNSCLTTQMSWSYSGTYILGLKLNKLNFGRKETLFKIVFKKIPRDKIHK